MDIYLQRAAPAGLESNWLPAPAGRFIFWPRLLLSMFRRALLVKGFGEGPVPVNTLYTEPEAVFADPLGARPSGSRLLSVGVNRDTLLTVGWLDLSRGPQVLRVPDMGDRYYSVQFTDPHSNTNFAYVGRRTTGTSAGAYLITGPGWAGRVPPGMRQIVSPWRSALVIGRVLVVGEGALRAAYTLSKQLRLDPLR